MGSHERERESGPDSEGRQDGMVASKKQARQRKGRRSDESSRKVSTRRTHRTQSFLPSRKRPKSGVPVSWGRSQTESRRFKGAADEDPGGVVSVDMVEDWVGGWMNGWMSGRVDEWMSEQSVGK